MFGGNLLIEIADQLFQFISVEKDIGNKAQPNYYNDMIKTFWMIYQFKIGKMNFKI